MVSEASKEWFSIVTRRLNFRMKSCLGVVGAKRRMTESAFESVLKFSLNIVSNCSLEIRSVVATERELLAVLHDDAILTVEPRLHFFDLVNLDNR